MRLEVIEKVKSFGFAVYMRDPSDTYMIYTDGRRIAYLEDDRNPFTGLSISTIHMANIKTGTGLQVYRHIDLSDVTKAKLEKAFEPLPFGPRSHGMKPGDADSVIPYNGIEEYRNASPFNAEYKRIF